MKLSTAGVGVTVGVEVGVFVAFCVLVAVGVGVRVEVAVAVAVAVGVCVRVAVPPGSDEKLITNRMIWLSTSQIFTTVKNNKKWCGLTTPYRLAKA